MNATTTVKSATTTQDRVREHNPPLPRMNRLHSRHLLHWGAPYQRWLEDAELGRAASIAGMILRGFLPKGAEILFWPITEDQKVYEYPVEEMHRSVTEILMLDYNLPVFSMVPFENRMKWLMRVWYLDRARFCTKAFHEFYSEVLYSGCITKVHFVPNWMDNDVASLAYKECTARAIPVNVLDKAIIDSAARRIEYERGHPPNPLDWYFRV